MMITLKNNIILLREQNGGTVKQPEKKTVLNGSAQLYEKPLCQSSLNKVRSQNMPPDSPAVASELFIYLITLH